MNINENAQNIVIPIDMESAMVITRPIKILSKLILSRRDTAPL